MLSMIDVHGGDSAATIAQMQRLYTALELSHSSILMLFCSCLSACITAMLYTPQHISDLLQQVIEQCNTQRDEALSSSSTSAGRQRARQLANVAEKQAAAAQWYLTDPSSAADNSDSADNNSGSSSSSSGTDAAVRPRCTFVDTLVSIQWMPVLTQLPSAALPCQKDASRVLVGLNACTRGIGRIEERAVAAPKDCRPEADKWLCSATLAVRT
jgi:hypothetical protein